MTEQIEHLILDHLRAIRTDVAAVKEGIREFKARVSSVEQHVANLVADVQRMNERFDRLMRGCSASRAPGTRRLIRTSTPVPPSS